jgi:hypothetical protein
VNFRPSSAAFITNETPTADILSAVSIMVSPLPGTRKKRNHQQCRSEAADGRGQQPGSLGRSRRRFACRIR